MLRLLGLALCSLVVATAAGCGGGGGDSSPPFDSSSALVVADFNGDGLNDIAAGVAHISGPPPHAGFVKVWLQRHGAPGSFESPISYEVGPDPAELLVADLNNDGAPDLVVVSATNNARGPPIDTVSLLSGDLARRGRFLPASTLHAGAGISAANVGDFDRDGRVDIAIRQYGLINGVSVWWNDPGGFGAPVLVSPGPASFIVTADVSGDGWLDLIFVGDPGVQAVQRDPATVRGFLPRTTLADRPSTYTSCLVAADLGRDGRTDFVLGTRESLGVGAPGHIVVLRPDPAVPGRYVPTQQADLEVHSFACMAVDMNRDGVLDIVTAEAGYRALFDDLIQVFLSSSSAPGTLLPPVNTVSSNTASGYYAAAGDLDGDGSPDVVIPYDGGVLIFRQDPTHPGTLTRGLALP